MEGWVCPQCGKRFFRKLGHSCTIVPLKTHFENRPRAEELFRLLEATIRGSCGPFRLSIARTRIGLINGITFAAVMPRRTYLRFHFLLKRRIDSDRFVRIDFHEPWFVHTLELRSDGEIDDDLLGWLQESYRLGIR